MRREYTDLLQPERSSTPTSPTTGFKQIYPKTDNRWYSLDSLGTERILSPHKWEIELRRWTAAWSKRNERAANVLLVGDSVLEGYGPSNIIYRPVHLLRRYLQQFSDAAGGEGYVPSKCYTGLERWTHVGTHDLTDYGFGLGRYSRLLNSSDDYSEIRIFGDRFWMRFTAGAAVAGAIITIDGVDQPVFNTNAVVTGVAGTSWDYDSGALTRGWHTVRVRPTNTGSVAAYSIIVDGIMVFDGEGSLPQDQVVSGVVMTSGSATVTGPGGTFSSGDTGKVAVGPGIPWGTTLTYVSATQATLSANATATITSHVQIRGRNPGGGKGVRLWNGAHSGAVATSFGDTAAIAKLWAQAARNVQPDLMIIELGINDYNTAQTLANTKTRLKGIVDNLDLIMTAAQRPSILIVPMWGHGTVVSDATWQTWRGMMVDLASENGYAVADVYEVAGHLGTGSGGSSDPMGLTLGASDTYTHPTNAGARLIASVIADNIVTGNDEIIKIEPRRQVNVLAENFTAYGAAYHPIIQELVTPLGTTLDIDVRIAGTKTGGAWPSFGIDWGVPDGLGYLRSYGQYAPLIAGASSRNLQSAGSGGALSYNVSLQEQVQITGLTPGVQIKIVLWSSCVGGFDTAPAGGFTNSNTKLVLLKNGSKGYIVEPYLNTVQQFFMPDGPYSTIAPHDLRSITRLKDLLRYRITVGTFPVGADASPDSSRLAVGNYTTSNLTVIDTATDTVERTVSLSSNPYCVTFINNTHCYVGCLNGHVYKVDVTDGSIDADITVAASVLMHDITIDATGTYAYVVGGATNLYRITISSNAVTTTAISENGWRVRVGVDGKIFIGYASSGSIHIRASDLSNYATVTLPTGFGTSDLTDMDITYDRKWLYVSYDNGGWAQMKLTADDDHWPGYDWFDYPDMGTFYMGPMAIGPQDGGIFYIVDTGVAATTYLAYFPNCRFDIGVISGAFGPAFAEMVVEGVV